MKKRRSTAKFVPTMKCVIMLVFKFSETDVYRVEKGVIMVFASVGEHTTAIR
jgi:hypothetical protein